MRKQSKIFTIQRKSGLCLTEECDVLDRWTEYCYDLYNYTLIVDPSVLACPQNREEEEVLPILREEVETAVKSLKKGKSAGVDNIPAQFLQAGGETLTGVLTIICNKIWQSGERPLPWT